MLVEMANIVREPREVSIDRDQEGAVGFEVVLCTMVGEKKHSYSEWSLAVRPFSGSWLCTRVCVRVCTYKNVHACVGDEERDEGGTAGEEWEKEATESRATAASHVADRHS